MFGWMERGSAPERAAAADPVNDGAPALPELTSPERWRWALVAAVVGALAGAVAALVIRRAVRAEPADAQDPSEVEAVVDRGPGAEGGPAGA